MNLSLSFKELATKQYVLTAKERLMVIITTGIIVVAITMYISRSEVTVESTLPQDTSEKIVTNANKTQVPTGEMLAQVNPGTQPLRDPFAKPPEVDKNPMPLSAPPIHNNPNALPNMAPSVVPHNTAVTNIPQRDFKLTGIVSDGSHHLAVIMSGNKSNSYGVNDAIGAYRIAAITNDYVVLTSNGQKITLRLESFRQKEGTSSDK